MSENTNMQELELSEMEKASGGFKTEMLNAEELAVYNNYLKLAENGTAQAKKGLLTFKNEMRRKYGKQIFDTNDYLGILKS